MAECPIQELFDRQMYHVLEEIFLLLPPLDLDSCKLVNTQWNRYFKHHFWAIPKIRRQLMERKQKLIDENRRTSNYIRTDHNINLSVKFWSLAANRHWIAVGLLDGRIVIIDSITNNQKVLDPPDGHVHALVALNDRSAVVVLSKLCLVFEDWIQEQAIKLDINSPSRILKPIITPKSKSLICLSDTNKITVFTKQTGEYKHALIIELNRNVKFFDANDEVVVTEGVERHQIKIWSTGSGQLIKAMNVHDGFAEPIQRLYLSGMGGSKIFYTKHDDVMKVLIIDWETEEQEALPLAKLTGDLYIEDLCWDEDGSAYISFWEDDEDQECQSGIVSLTKPISLLKLSKSSQFDGLSGSPNFPDDFSLTEMGTLVYVTQEEEVITVTSLKYFH